MIETRVHLYKIALDCGRTFYRIFKYLEEFRRRKKLLNSFLDIKDILVQKKPLKISI